MTKSSAFKAACLGASLATAWSATEARAATDFQVTAQENLSVPISNVMFIVGGQGFIVPNQADGSSAVMGNWAGTIALSMPDNFASQPWVMVGEGTGALSSDVFVAWGAGTLAINQPFETVFQGTTEAAIADKISSRNSVDMDKFMLALESSSQIPGVPSSAILFSNGVNIGTVGVSVTAVPEPGGLGILGLALGGLLRRFRRRR